MPWMKHHIAGTLIMGLGLGAVAGLIESIVLVVGLDETSDIGNVPLLAVALWSGMGLIVAGGTVATTRRANLDNAQQIATVTGRTALLLVGLAVVVSVNTRWLPDVLDPSSVAWNFAMFGVFVGGWFLTVRITGRRTVGGLLVGVSRISIVLVVLAVGGAFGLSRAVREPVRLTVFAPSGQMFNGPAEIARQATAPDVMLLGVDAATWDIILPWIEAGKLPNMRKLMEQGTWGVLKSYDPSASPVVWTSIMTGKAPEEHGLSTWATATALNRKVKAVWQIATEAGRPCAVVNVPGSHPVRDDCALMLTGIPFPLVSLGNTGWFATTGNPVTDDICLSIPLRFDPAAVVSGMEVRRRIELRDLPASLPSRTSIPVSLLSRAAKSTSLNMEKYFGSVTFGTIELVFKQDPTGADIVVEGFADDKLFTLGRGTWSPWLVADSGRGRQSLRVHFVNTDPDEVTLYFTPFVSYPDPQRATRAGAIVEALSTPYVAEGVGWHIFYESRLLSTLREHMLNVSLNRIEAGLAILDRMDLDLFVFVFTVTDRMQHAMMKFMEPETYRELARREGGGYAKFEPTPEQVARHGDAISDAYENVDRWLGMILERADADTTVVLVSDHGATAGKALDPTAGEHDPNGIYIIAKTQTDASSTELAKTRGPELILEDITPVVLHALDLPVALDMKGKLPAFLVAEDETPATVATYEDASGPTAGPKQLDAALKQQIRSLGYVD
jgi:hypothetical protein